MASVSSLRAAAAAAEEELLLQIGFRSVSKPLESAAILFLASVFLL